MRKPVKAFYLYCDGCGERFMAEDYGFFGVDWPFDEYGWVCHGDIDLCEDCKRRFEGLVETLVDGYE